MLATGGVCLESPIHTRPAPPTHHGTLSTQRALGSHREQSTQPSLSFWIFPAMEMDLRLCPH